MLTILAIKRDLQAWILKLIQANRPMWRDDGVDVGRASIIDVAGTATKDGEKITISSLSAATHDIGGASHAGTLTAGLHGILASGNLHPEYLTPDEHTAIGSMAPHHDEAHAVLSHSDANASDSPVEGDTLTWLEGRWQAVSGALASRFKVFVSLGESITGETFGP